MTGGMTCEDCIHAFARDPDLADDDIHIECRRYPPQVWFNTVNLEPEQGFPWAREVCGEFTHFMEIGEPT